MTHGEPSAARSLADLLEQKIGAKTFVPDLEDGFDLEPLLG